MKRSWNWALWIGFVLFIVGFLSYEWLVRFPLTRDFPWVNLLLFGAGGIFIVVGLFRAFGRPRQYRGKIFGPILTILSLLLVALFAYGLFYIARQMPPSTRAPRVGEKAPDFSLPDTNGELVSLSDLLASGRGAVLIFYRGYW